MANSSFPDSPDKLFGSLFRDVQLERVFDDSKTFVDCVPKLAPPDLVALYEREKDKPDFDLRTFVEAYFVVPDKINNDYVSDRSIPTGEHINRLWERLTRPPDAHVEGSSRVPLPYPYIVPGGRFREIFYWDSYFTMLGLKEAGRADLIRSMIDNFAYLIDTFGFVPNGNRTYFLSRSQPPYFSLMVKLLSEIDGKDVLVTFLPQLRREYSFWMDHTRQSTDAMGLDRRTVHLAHHKIVNRHWDDTPTPRPEAYRVEVELARTAEPLGVDPEELHTHIRAACESGWDFSSRWLADHKTMTSIHAADIVPVDLNCLLYALETALREACELAGEPAEAERFGQLAETRKELIQTLFWNENTLFFHDYDALAHKPTISVTLAGVFPLFFGLASAEQASHIHDQLKTSFLQAGGWVTTLNQTGQQWDWPNGWAPLQWIVYRGLMNYGFAETASQGRDNWLALNDKVFRATGKMMEKYNVADAALTAGGGKYPNQDGFGWTNGVYLALEKEKKQEGRHK